VEPARVVELLAGAGASLTTRKHLVGTDCRQQDHGEDPPSSGGRADGWVIRLEGAEIISTKIHFSKTFIRRSHLQQRLVWEAAGWAIK